jgi:hypothetical protein
LQHSPRALADVVYIMHSLLPSAAIASAPKLFSSLHHLFVYLQWFYTLPEDLLK